MEGIQFINNQVQWFTRNNCKVSNLRDDDKFFVVTQNGGRGKFHTLHSTVDDMLSSHPPKGLAKGDKVTYKTKNKRDRGFVKRVLSNCTHAFVVYTNDENAIDELTAQMTPISDLSPGW